MWVIYDHLNNLVSMSRLENLSDPTNLFEKEVKDVDMNTHSWNPETLDFVENAKDHLSISPSSFLRMFTIPERISIREKAISDKIVGDLLDLLHTVDYVDIDDKDTVMGLQYLMSVGCITPSRYQEILSNFN